MQPIILFLSYARSGGTLFSRCLESMGEVVVVSEVHPYYNPHLNLSEQVQQEIGITLKSGAYLDQLIELNNILEKMGKKLILRDWSFIDFTPHQINDFNPSRSMVNYHLISGEIPFQAFSVVRDAIDIWISRACPPLFYPYYLDYLKTVLKQDIHITRFEDFCLNPILEMEQLCEQLGLKFDPNFETQYRSVSMLGDSIASNSRGLTQQKIAPLPRKAIGYSLIKYLEKDQSMFDANQLGGYPCLYKNRDFTHYELLKEELIYRVKKSIGRYPMHKY